MKMLSRNNPSRCSVGVGLRYEHYDVIVDGVSSIDFVEVHAENFFVDGGPALAILQQVSQSMPVSLHGTSLGLGAEGRLTRADLRPLKRLVDYINPSLVSDHACFSWTRDTMGLRHSGDLLPMVWNKKALGDFVANVDYVQQVLGRQLLVENISSYVSLSGSTMDEFEFLQQVCHQTGAGLLLDINNIYVNAVNAGCGNPLAATEYVLAGINGAMVGEIHLAGSTPVAAGALLVDDHGAEVADEVWQAYQYAIAAWGGKPTLVEWDTRLPDLAILVNQASHARRIMDACVGGLNQALGGG